jgi:hypothetical protein
MIRCTASVSRRIGNSADRVASHPPVKATITISSVTMLSWRGNGEADVARLGLADRLCVGQRRDSTIWILPGSQPLLLLAPPTHAAIDDADNAGRNLPLGARCVGRRTPPQIGRA